MTRSTRHLVGLAAVAVLLIAAVLWVGRRDYVLNPPTLTGLAPTAVNKVTLRLPPLAPQSFVRRAHGWWRVQPDAARADAARIDRLAHLAATPVTRWIPATQITPANVGLEHPSATLTLDGIRLEYGGLTAIDGLRYVRVGAEVALVPRQYSPEVMLTKGSAK